MTAEDKAIYDISTHAPLARCDGGCKAWCS